MDSFTIRDFSARDAGDVVRIHSESMEFFEDMEVDAEFIKAISRRRDFHLFVAETEGKVVGFCGILYYPSVARAEVGPLAVDLLYRGRGVASALLSRVEGYALANGINRFMAKSKAVNRAGIDFFIAAGFHREALLERYTLAGEDVVQLVKFLQSSFK